MVKKQTVNYLFTDIKKCFVELLVNTPEDVEVKYKQTTDDRIFISLVDLWRFTWKQCGHRLCRQVSQEAKPDSSREQKLTNSGLNISEDGANVGGKLLRKGAVFGYSYSFYVKSLLHTGLSQKNGNVTRLMLLIAHEVWEWKKGSYLQYHAIQQLSLKLEQELLKRFQLLFRYRKFPRVMVHRFQQPITKGCKYNKMTECTQIFYLCKYVDSITFGY